jgi:hypothetical protein
LNGDRYLFTCDCVRCVEEEAGGTYLISSQAHPLTHTHTHTSHTLIHTTHTHSLTTSSRLFLASPHLVSFSYSHPITPLCVLFSCSPSISFIYVSNGETNGDHMDAQEEEPIADAGGEGEEKSEKESEPLSQELNGLKVSHQTNS